MEHVQLSKAELARGKAQAEDKRQGLERGNNLTNLKPFKDETAVRRLILHWLRVLQGGERFRYGMPESELDAELGSNETEHEADTNASKRRKTGVTVFALALAKGTVEALNVSAAATQG